MPLHLQPALRFLGHAEGSLPETERAAADNLALPLWAGIGADVQERVVETIRSGCSRGRGVIPVNRHRIWQILADAVLIALAWYLAFQLRFDARPRRRRTTGSSTGRSSRSSC